MLQKIWRSKMYDQTTTHNANMVQINDHDKSLWLHYKCIKTSNKSTTTNTVDATVTKQKKTAVVLTVQHWANYRNNSQTDNNHRDWEEHAALFCDTRSWQSWWIVGGEWDKLPKITDSRELRILARSWSIVSRSLATTTVTIICKQMQ